MVVVALLLASRSSAQYGYALSFAGASSQYITVPHSSSINLGTSFTIEAWVNYAGINSTIVDKGNYDFLFQVSPSPNGIGKLGFYTGATSSWVYSTAAVPQGVATHVAVVGNGGTIIFYINGVASGGGTGTSRQDNLPMNIGRQQPSSCQCNYFNGTMDELRIWNLVRTPAQIAASMSSSVPANSTGLVAYYKFDEGGGTTTADASGNANTGTIVNAPTWASSVSGSLAGGSVGIGTNTPSPNAALDITSTDKGLMLPRITDTSAVPNPTAGLLIYNISAKSPAFYDGTKWQTLLSTGNSGAIDPNADSIVYQIGPNNAGLSGGWFKVSSLNMGGTVGEDRATANVTIPWHINAINLQKRFMQTLAISGQLEILVFKRGAPAASYAYKFTNTSIVATSNSFAENELSSAISYTIKADKMSYKDVVNNISFGWSYVSPVGLTTY